MYLRREVPEFSLSFLDVISCGFGAIILLLVIIKVVEPVVLEQTSLHLDGLLADLQEQLFEIRGETKIFNRELTVKREQLSEDLEKLARLQGELSAIQGQFMASHGPALSERGSDCHHVVADLRAFGRSRFANEEGTCAGHLVAADRSEHLAVQAARRGQVP